MLYLHAPRLRFFGFRRSTWTRDPLPDVVLEVDHTTDVRRRKLGIYMECGFPEIWVLVPWVSSRRQRGADDPPPRGGWISRGTGERGVSGLEGGGDPTRAHGGPAVGAKTWRALERVALAMGAREGTSPENDPLMRSVHRTAEARGDARGYARGRAEGQVEGCLEAVATALRARGIGFTRTLTEYRELFAEAPD